MKVIISHSIGEEILYCGGLMFQDQPTYIIYMALANIDEPYHATPDFLRNGIKNSSALLKFKYEIVFQGRQFYDRLDSLPQQKIETVLKKRIEFLNPTDIFIPTLNYNSSSNIINYAVKNMYHGAGINILEYGLSEGTYHYMLTTEAMRRKKNALSSFGDLLPHTRIDIQEYYNIYRVYNEVPGIRKE